MDLFAGGKYSLFFFLYSPSSFIWILNRPNTVEKKVFTGCLWRKIYEHATSCAPHGNNDRKSYDYSSMTLVKQLLAFIWQNLYAPSSPRLYIISSYYWIFFKPQGVACYDFHRLCLLNLKRRNSWHHNKVLDGDILMCHMKKQKW